MRPRAVWSALLWLLLWVLLAVALPTVIPHGGPPDESSAETVHETAPVIVAPPLPAGEGFRPDRIRLPRLSIDAAVTPAGTTVAYDPFLGRAVDSFGVPDDMRSTTWWSEGPAPGSGGLAVILGHTQIGGGYGVFNDIGTLGPGERIDVTGVDAAASFVVREVVSGIDKRDPGNLSRVLSDHADTAGIALITCGGLFDADRRASADNIVVIAERVGSA
ncbi:class F sortase [Nocardia sp. NBC_01503]|uniref:class F sortase n=1 Tax=Nocardia sp. NBC_01503 TaxID=2975997 RepID=UPI002E7B9BEF|nr:class F sortase [Nocardia sp. NBC_01503]WTL30597.1 class F sortase [Nocardia sp. NBC_01503]